MTEAVRKQPMKTIGRINCLACGEQTPVKEQSNGFAAVSCNWCGLQMYARAPKSDKLLRDEMKPEERAAPPAAAATAPAAPTDASIEPGEPAKSKKKSGSIFGNL